MHSLNSNSGTKSQFERDDFKVLDVHTFFIVRPSLVFSFLDLLVVLDEPAPAALAVDSSSDDDAPGDSAVTGESFSSRRDDDGEDTFVLTMRSMTASELLMSSRVFFTNTSI